MPVIERLLTLGQSLVSGTQLVWCIQCRTHQKTIKVRYAKKGNSKRLVGKCTNCFSETSTFLGR